MQMRAFAERAGTNIYAVVGLSGGWRDLPGIDYVASYVTAADGAGGLARCGRFSWDAGQCGEAGP